MSTTRIEGGLPVGSGGETDNLVPVLSPLNPYVRLPSYLIRYKLLNFSHPIRATDIFKMFSRPGSEDTESDLLRFQDEFLAGRLNPSAAVVRSNKGEESRSSCAGDKRDSPCGPQLERDVVTLEGNRFHCLRTLTYNNRKTHQDLRIASY